MVTTLRVSSRSQFRSRDENAWVGLEVRNSVSTDPEAITISVRTGLPAEVVVSISASVSRTWFRSRRYGLVYRHRFGPDGRRRDIDAAKENLYTTPGSARARASLSSQKPSAEMLESLKTGPVSVWLWSQRCGLRRSVHLKNLVWSR